MVINWPKAGLILAGLAVFYFVFLDDREPQPTGETEFIKGEGELQQMMRARPFDAVPLRKAPKLKK